MNLAISGTLIQSWGKVLCRNIYISITFLLLSCTQVDTRKKLVIFETGVNVTSEIAPFFCTNGHKNFLPRSSWNEDKIGHGTSITKVLAQKMNPEKSCIVVYKTADQNVESNKKAEAYATALMNLASQDFDILLLALEDVSYFYKEIEWFNTLLSKPNVQIVVAAGNGGVQLLEKNKCMVFPACLKPKLLNSDRFHIVGSTDGDFNDGPLVSAKRSSRHGQESGTSFSAARYASELMDKN